MWVVNEERRRYISEGCGFSLGMGSRGAEGEGDDDGSGMYEK